MALLDLPRKGNGIPLHAEGAGAALGGQSGAKMRVIVEQACCMVPHDRREQE